MTLHEDLIHVYYAIAGIPLLVITFVGTIIATEDLQIGFLITFGVMFLSLFHFGKDFIGRKRMKKKKRRAKLHEILATLIGATLWFPVSIWIFFRVLVFEESYALGFLAVFAFVIIYGVAILLIIKDRMKKKNYEEKEL